MLEITQEEDCTPPMYWLNVYSTPANLWQVLKWWWKQRKVWYTELFVNHKDLTDLAEYIRSMHEYAVDRDAGS